MMTLEERFRCFVYDLTRCKTITFRYKDIPYLICDIENTTTLENCSNGERAYFGKRSGTFDDRIDGRKQLLCAKLFDGKAFNEAFDEIKILTVSEE